MSEYCARLRRVLQIPGEVDPESQTLQRVCRCVKRVLRVVADGSGELMVASHNQASVAAAAVEMRRLGLDPATAGAQHPP